MRVHLFSILMLSCGISASGANIKEFVIVNSQTMDISGGLFTSGSGTFSGHFEVDVSQIPQGGVTFSQVALTDWDIVITSSQTPSLNVEFRPGNTTGSLHIGLEQDMGDLGPAQIDILTFQKDVGSDVVEVMLPMLEPVGLFRGGVVLNASAIYTNFTTPPFGQTGMRDNFGTGTVVDPALFAPEPGCGLLLAAGLGFVAARRLRVAK